MIEIIKPTPSDAATKRILIEWFKAARPKWKLPADICIGTFFTAMTIYSFMQTPVPFFTWLALGGACLSFLAAFAYVPFLATMALNANKKLPSYFKEKTYRFYPTHLEYSYEGAQTVTIPLEKFTEVRLTGDFVLFLIGDKLALWFSQNDVGRGDWDTILRFLNNNNVVIKGELSPR
ncbi:hypothetical protein QET93_009115 [Akkermansia sp. N21116]|uniref:hypothetical protein n=1 Tax=Akkermansia sp. N21116 TaxID=3040764 RepID=UPI00244ECE46|nr:hypothetical protein [Akkermansia sp. N21116]WPX39695.1 hypothetical protein QET93_009115 [Akkermansia sp. N21116]